jgi:hypothetical protein
LAVLGVACPQGWRLTAIFYPLGHPTPYAYIFISVAAATLKTKQTKYLKNAF